MAFLYIKLLSREGEREREKKRESVFVCGKQLYHSWADIQLALYLRTFCASHSQPSDAMPMNVELTDRARTTKDVDLHLSRAGDIFEKVPRETGIDHGFDQYVMPHYLGTQTVTFRLEPDYVHHIEANKTRLYTRFNFTKEDGTAIGAAREVAPVNIFPAAMIKSCELRVNDLVAAGAGQNHLAYKTYLEAMTMYDAGARESHLESDSLFYPDTPGKFETCGDENIGYKNRAALVNEGGSVEVMFKFNLDAFNVDKPFPPGLKLNLTLTLNDPAWMMMSGEAAPNYKVNVSEMQLVIRKLKFVPAIASRHEQALAKGAHATYAYKRHVFKKMYLNFGEQTFYWQNAFNGPLPSEVFMFMNENDADLGSYKLNPFHFQEFGLSRVSLTRDGKEVEVYDVDVAGGRFLKALHALYDNIGIDGYNAGCMIDGRLFQKGCTIFSWNLSPDKRNALFEGHGGMDMHTAFKNPLAKRVCVHLLGVYDDILRITPDRRMETTTA